MCPFYKRLDPKVFHIPEPTEGQQGLRLEINEREHFIVTRVPMAPRTGGISRICLLLEDITERWR
jgi:hypothetical protein